MGDHIKMGLQGVGWAGLVWLRFGQVAVVCECDNEPLGSMNVGSFLTS